MQLLKAYHFAESFVREGVPVWWDESDDVMFDVEKKISRSRAAVTRAEKSESGNDKEVPPGRYYIPVPRTMGGKPMPTFDDWVKDQGRKSGKNENKTRP